jgi:hypothetical protein
MKTITTLEELEAHIKECFNSLEKPSEDFLKIKENPQDFRDEYFFNNGVKTTMAMYRPTIEKYVKDLTTTMNALRVSVEALKEITSDADSTFEKNTKMIAKTALDKILPPEIKKEEPKEEAEK